MLRLGSRYILVCLGRLRMQFMWNDEPINTSGNIEYIFSILLKLLVDIANNILFVTVRTMFAYLAWF